MELSTEESPGKLMSSSKKKLKEKTNSGSSLKGSLSNSLFSSSNSNTSSNVGRMDTSDLPPSFQNDHTLSSSSTSEGKLSNFVTGLKNHTTTPDTNSSSAKPSKKKSGSESSASGASISGGQGSLLTNSTHSDSGSRRSLAHAANRGFSSGSSDAEDEKDKERKHHLNCRSKAVKATKSSTLESDDEATDSADEGNSEGEERGRRRRRGEISSGVLGLRQSNRLMSRKDSSESTNSATSPMISSSLTTSTIFVESALPKEPMIGSGSPVNMAVGYGAASDSMAPPSVFDKTPPQSPLRTPTMDSPKMVSDGQRSPGTPIPLSPSSVEATERPSSMTAAASSSATGTSGVSLNPVQPSPSLQGSSFNLPFENWVYQAQAVYSPFPLSGSHPGSVATTPVAVESGPYLRTGAPVLLRGTVCQESEGVLIVSVQWRNKTFSGSLIDMNQHEWAPPRLAGDFDEPLTHLKDLCKQQEKRETENQQVNVDVEGDDSAKDMTNGSEKMDSSTKEEEPSNDSAPVLESSMADKNSEGKTKGKGQLDTSNHLPGEQHDEMETNEVARRPKLPRNQSIESELGDMEIVEEPTQSQFSSVSIHKPKLGAAKVSVDSVYSDISDVSDSEDKGKREGSSQPSQSSDQNGVSQAPPFVASEHPSSHSQASRGSRPKKIPAEEIQHTLPPFSAISVSSTQDPLDKKYDRRLKPKAGDEKDSSDSSASILRSNLLSSYPSTSTTGSATVSTPNQNHRHSFASNTSGSHTAVTGSVLGNNAVIHGPTMASSEHPKSHSDPTSKSASKSSNFSIESLNACASGDGKDQKLVHGRSSPHPLSLKSREHRGRSSSPLRKTKRDPPNLPPFNATGVAHQDMTKATTLDYMPPGPGHRSHGTADDSDSSGSGSILSTHRKKKSAKQHRKGAEPLTGLKDGKEEGNKAPETPALGPIGIHTFNLRIQPISPGIDYSAQQQHMPSSMGKDGPAVPVSVSSASTLSSPARSPAARVASPHTTTVGDVMGALLTTGSGSTFKEGSMSNLRSLREAEKGEKESHAKEPPLTERRHTGSSSSPSSVSSTSIAGVSLGMPAPGYPLPRVPQGVIQAPSQTMKHDQFKMRSPIPPETPRQDREDNQPPRKRKNSPTTATGESSKHSSSGAEHEDAVNPESALRGQHQAHAFQQQGFPPYLQEGEKMEGLPADFSYDPNLPMNIHYQLLSYVNQKKAAQAKEYEDQLKEINRKDKEEIERQASHISMRQQQQQNPRPAKRARIGEHHHMTPPVAPLQMPHHSPPAAGKDHSVKQKKPSHHQHRVGGPHMDHSDERHFTSSHSQPHPINIKSEPFDISRHSSHKPPSASIVKQPQPHQGQRAQPLQNTSSKVSSHKPQSRVVKPEQTFIKTEAGSEQQSHHLPQPGAIPGWPVIPVPYQYSIFPQQQHQQQAHSLQGKEAKVKDHKEHREGSQQAALHAQTTTPIVALSAGGQSWPTGASFIHTHSNIIQPGVSNTERSSRQEHTAITSTTSVITGKDSTSDLHSPSHHRSHRSMGQSSPSSAGKKSSNFASESGSDRRSAPHKMHSGHEHGRAPSSNSVQTNRRMEGPSTNQRAGPYHNQSDGEASRRSNSHPHSHTHSTASSASSASSSSSTTQQSSSHSSSSRSHKSADYLASTQLQAQAQAASAAVHQINAALQQQQQQQSLASPLPGMQLRQGIPIAPGLIPANMEEWARMQELIQKGQVGIGSADQWQQQMQHMQQMMLAQGVVPIDPATLQALQQQQQQQQHQSAEQAANALQNLQFLQAAAATGGIQFMQPTIAGAHPAMAGLYDPVAFGTTTPMLPFPMPATAQKRES